MSKDVRYKPGDAGNNALLRLALLDAWGNRCYICGEPLDFTDAEIDHIIPDTIGQPELRELLTRCLTDEARAEGFDIHAPHNLAPICNPCNKKKGANTYLGAGQVMVDLSRARSRQPHVERRVKSFKRVGAVSRAMLSISIADLAEPKARTALLELGPMVVTRLRAVAPEILNAPSNYDYPGDPHGDEMDRVLVTLDEPSRRAKIILEDVHEVDFNSVITDVTRAVKPEVERHLQHKVEQEMQDKGRGDAIVDDGGGGRMFLEFSSVSYDATDRNFVARGEFEMDGAVAVNVASVTADSGTEWVDEYADVAGTFSATFWPDPDSPCGVIVDSPVLD